MDVGSIGRKSAMVLTMPLEWVAESGWRWTVYK